MDKIRNVIIAAAVILMAGITGATAQNNPVPASDYCADLASKLGGLPIPNGDVCDVVVVRKSPIIEGQGNMNLNRFTLMNSVLEFSKTGRSNNEVYVMGDFALLETEVNNVLSVITRNKWTITGMHNHMILESPKMSFVHWEAQGNTDTIVDQANQAFAQTSIK